MPTLQTYQQTILSAQLIMANLLTANLNKLKIGDEPVYYSTSRQYEYNTIALQYQLNQNDLTSSTTLTIYDRLSGLIGVDTTANVIDPNYQAPNTTIIVTNTSPSFQYMNKTQVNLIYDTGIASYYLPFLNNSGSGFPIGSVPITILLNGVQMEPALNTGFTPQRIYGFANNAGTQVITVTVAVPAP